MHTQHSHTTSATVTPDTDSHVIRSAGWYDRFVNLATGGKRATLRRASIAQAQLAPGEQVLEVGCGTGDLALLAAAEVGATGRVVGIDPSPEMIAVAQHKASHANASVDFIVQPAEAMSFADASFDVVLSSLMMHHLPPHLKQPALREIGRVLAPNGRLLIIDLRRPESLPGRVITHLLMHGQMQFGVQDLPLLLQQTSFRVRRMGDLPVWNLGFIEASLAEHI